MQLLTSLTMITLQSSVINTTVSIVFIIVVTIETIFVMYNFCDACKRIELEIPIKYWPKVEMLITTTNKKVDIQSRHWISEIDLNEKANITTYPRKTQAITLKNRLISLIIEFSADWSLWASGW